MHIRFALLPTAVAALAVLLTVALATPDAVHAQTAADSAAIRATALDYIEGFYTGDAARMERALHTDLDVDSPICGSCQRGQRLYRRGGQPGMIHGDGHVNHSTGQFGPGDLAISKDNVGAGGAMNEGLVEY